jgi:nucleotide-binding universal stress UspA family protein
MNDRAPKHILCAVRGQPRSRDTASQAITLALETGARLTFALIINAEFMSQVAPTMGSLRAVYQQLEEMGEFAMLVLCERAERRGVPHVDSIIQKGTVRDELLKMVTEMNPEVLVVGKPSGQSDRDVFTLAEFANFIAELELLAGLQVVQVAYTEPDNSAGTSG